MAAPADNGSKTDQGTPADQDQAVSVNAEEVVEQMKKWLLFNKHTNTWETTKATVAACYALLYRGEDWLETTPDKGTITVGKKQLATMQPNMHRDAGTDNTKTS